MSESSVPAVFTEADHDEWRALHDAASDLFDRARVAESDAGNWLVWRLTRPASADFALRQALELAQHAFDLRAEWRAAYIASSTHPYAVAMIARVAHSEAGAKCAA